MTTQAAFNYYKRDFWIEENLKYAEPHFRLTKAARVINKIAGRKKCELLDVGCGPAALSRLLRKNIDYYGIDIAIHKPAPNLIQADFLESPIAFCNKHFDIILAQGVFEYVGTFQEQKFSEIAQILEENGRFVVSYVNFAHRKRDIYWPYSNIQPPQEFRKSLARYFHVERFFPTSHHLHHHEPRGRFMPVIQRYINVNIPIISHFLAVEYFFICSPLAPSRSG